MMTSIKRALSSFLFSVLAIGLCVVLAACGSDDPIDISDNSGETTNTSSTNTDSSENSSETSSTTSVTTPPEQTVITTSGGPVDDTTSSSQNSQQQTSNSSSSSSSNSMTTATNSGGTGGPFAPGINCDLSGNWRGVFYNDVTGVSEAIQATVTRTGLDIIIRTSRTRPPGQLLTGSVNGQCGIRVIDAFDGEDWTTKFGGADANQIRIADFLIEDRDELTGRDPLNIIELVR